VSMHERYQAALREAEEKWQDGERPPEITAVALATGLDPEELWDEVEGKCGWESHDAGYPHVVWGIAWGLKDFPDWQAPRGDKPVGGP